MNELVLFDINDPAEISTINDTACIKTIDGIRTIYVRRYVFNQYPVEDVVAERFSIVTMARASLASQRELARAFDCHYNTVSNYIQSYDQAGIEGLIPQKTGPKGPITPSKVTPAIRQFIFEAADSNPHIQLKEVVQLVKDKYAKDIHPCTASRLLSAYRLSKKQPQQQPQPEQLTLLDAPAQEQLTDAAIAEQSSDMSERVETANDNSAQNSLEENADPVLVAEPTDSEIDEEEDADLLEQLAAGIDSRYGAGLLLNPFIEKLGLVPLLIDSVLEQRGVGNNKECLHELLNPSRIYGLVQMFLMFIYAILFRFPSIESLKLIDRPALGPLLGREKAPVNKTVRRFMKCITQLKIAGNVTMKLARQYARLEIVKLGVLYLDGHFIPYYGKANISKGYFASKQMPLKGNYHYFANDRTGRPIFFRITSAAVHFAEIIPEMVREVQIMMAELGIKGPLIVAFDRGGFDVKLFKILDQMGVLWITWRKCDSPVALDLFTEKIYEPGSDKEEPKIKYYAYRRPIEISKEKYVAEAISFFEEGEEDPSTMVTNAFRFPNDKYPDFVSLTTGQVIAILTNRWKQENFFKTGKREYYLDYTPSYPVCQLNEQPMVKNPKRKELDKELQKLQKDYRKIQTKIAEKIINSETSDKPLSHLLNTKSYRKLSKQKETLEQQIEELIRKKSTEPIKVTYTETKPHERVELGLEEKYLFDDIKIAVYNMSEKLLDIFTECYDDSKDIYQILQMIIERGAKLQLIEGVLYVTINKMDRPKYQRAAEQLCCKLNEMLPVTLDARRLPIIYKVASK